PPHDSTVVETEIVLFARVLHDHIVGRLEIPGSNVSPVVSVGFRIVNGNRVAYSSRIHPLERIGHFHILAMRMAIRVEPRIAIEAGGFDDQLISLPMPRR